MIYEQLLTFCQTLTNEFDKIPLGRKQLLEKIAGYIITRMNENKPVQLVYICTHNSRRSHFGQIWSRVAAAYYNKNQVCSFSGGTESTALNINAVNALKRVGFHITTTEAGNNPVYEVKFGTPEAPIACFSKIYNHAVNPQTGFAAIMTCSEAEENCPFIPGADFRIATPYDDPKSADGTNAQDVTYDERCKQIARETFYMVSKLNPETHE